MKLALLVVSFLIVGLVIGGLGGGAASFHYHQRLQSYSWLAPLAGPTPPPAPTPAPTPPPATPAPTPTPVAQSCVLWSSDGQWNVTIYGDRADQQFPGYCQAAQHSKFAMHVAGPASGNVTCDMTVPGLGERFVFADTATRAVLPCDRAAPFFDATRAPQ